MARPKTNNTPVEEEKIAQAEAEAMPRHSTEASQDAAASNIDEEVEKDLAVEEGADTDQVLPAEVTAIHVDNESARELNKSVGQSKLDRKKEAKATRQATKSEKVSQPSKVTEVASRRSKNYLAAHAKVEPGKLYQLPEALNLVKELSLSKFDGSVELHLRLNKKKTKGSTESTRGVVHLPHGTGKDKQIVVLDEKMIDEIAKTKKIPFDVAIASPELMPKVAKIAKILGPQGKMPDPKSGTVTTDPAKVIAEIKAGKTEYRIDASGIIHQIIGKVSWSEEKLLENAKAVLALQPKSRLATVFVSASIGPSLPLDLAKL